MAELRVSTNSLQENLIRQLNINQSNLVTLQKQLATGRKVTLPEDDPISMSRALSRESQKREISQYHTNNIIAGNLINTSQLHIDELKNLGELALGIANATGVSSSDTEIDANRRQLNEIVNQALDIANAKLDGEYLFAGVDFSSNPYSIDDGGTPTDESDDTIAYNGSPTDRSDPNFDEAEYYVGKNTKIAPKLNPEHNVDVQNYIQAILDLRNSFDSTAGFDASTVASASANLESAEDQLLIASTDLATKSLRLDIAAQSDSQLFNQLDEAIALEVGADITDVAVRINQAQTSYEAALASASRILNISLLNYI